MIISHKYRFVFVKTMKTAGTSIEIYLSRHCGPDDVVTPIHPRVEPHAPRNHDGYFNHMPAAGIRATLGVLWDSYFTFCVERNPWDKVLSYFHMTNVRNGGRLDFDAYLGGDDFPVDHPRYTEPGRPERVIVDRVLRYESLAQDLASVFGPLGIPFAGTLGVNAKSEYRKDRRPYRDVYTEPQARRVGEVFARECSLFDYRF